MSEKIQREKLYEDVWSVPMTRLCKSYGMSYDDFKRLCRQLNIPTPQRGHWARVSAGYVVRRPPLPSLGESSLQESPKHATTRQPDQQHPASVTPIFRDEPIMSATGFHPALQPLVVKCLEAEKKAKQWKADFDRTHTPHQRLPKGEPRGIDTSWEYFCEKGQILNQESQKSALRALRASPSTWQRAIRLFQALADHLETLGYTIRLAKGMARLEAIRNNLAIEMRIAEKLEPKYHTRINSWSKEPRSIKSLDPTGQLIIRIEYLPYKGHTLTDRRDNPLEAQWAKIIATVEIQHSRGLAHKAEWVARDRAYEEKRQAGLEAQRLQEEAKQREEAERQMRAALVQEATDWRTAETIRAYLAHLEHCRSEGGMPSAGYEEWREWAGRVADSLDKSRSRVIEIGPGPEQP